MRTDGEIERLSEMPADSINLPPGKRGTSARPAVAARRLGYINHATGRKRAWQLLALNSRGTIPQRCPLLKVNRPRHLAAVTSQIDPERSSEAFTRLAYGSH